MFWFHTDFMTKNYPGWNHIHFFYLPSSTYMNEGIFSRDTWVLAGCALAECTQSHFRLYCAPRHCRRRALLQLCVCVCIVAQHRISLSISTGWRVKLCCLNILVLSFPAARLYYSCDLTEKKYIFDHKNQNIMASD